MPKITFVNEHRQVEVEQGTLLSEAAERLGIAVRREQLAGTGMGDSTVWVEPASGALSRRGLYERFIKGCRGERRLADRARVLADCKVWTQQGIGSRTGVQRRLEPAPRAGEDGSARLDHAESAAPTAWNIHGHPHQVGGGSREPPKYEPKKKKTAAKKAAVAKAPAKKAEPATKKAEPPEAAPEAAATKSAAPEAAPEAAATKSAAPEAKAEPAADGAAPKDD